MPRQQKRKKNESKSKKCAIVSRISNWWKRKNSFYLVQENSPDADETFEDEHSNKEEEDSREEGTIMSPDHRIIGDTTTGQGGNAIEPALRMVTPEPSPQGGKNCRARAEVESPTNGAAPRNVPDTNQLLLITPSSRSPYPFVRSRTADSFQGSLESIDSLAESHWDPHDDESQTTPIATNIVESTDFFEEHIDFLRVKTKARKVKVMWTTPTKPEHDPDDYSSSSPN
jgi:hypothetical protein